MTDPAEPRLAAMDHYDLAVESLARGQQVDPVYQPSNVEHLLAAIVQALLGILRVQMERSD